MKRLLPMFVFALLCYGLIAPLRAAIPVYGYRIVHVYPHDRGAYTEGFFYLDGYLYEATGEVGQSSVRKVELKTGAVVQQLHLDPPDFGEGIVAWKNRLIELTWQSQHGYIYDLATFKRIGQFDYPGEGWSLTQDGKHLFMSDGSPSIRILDPETLKTIGSILVMADGEPVSNINELEWVKGEIYANVWLTHRIARINPHTGQVVGWIDLSGLGPNAEELNDPSNDVLNGIAYDARHDRLFVTGKRWPSVYEIRLTEPAAPAH